MTKIQCIKSGVIYRNPIPHVKSVHAYFPSVVQLPDGQMVASMSLGQAFESADQHICFSRSMDNGETWVFEGAANIGPSNRPTSEYCRITAAGGDEIAAFLIKYNRSRVDAGLCNEATMGLAETDLAIMRSTDQGRTWKGPYSFISPLEGPSFEICCPIKTLRDGRWIIPTSTWRGWDGYCPNGMKAVAFVSYDRGNTWADYIDVMSDVENGIIFWESRVIELPDNRLLAVAWAYDEKNACDLPNHYALSDASGKVFSPARPTGLQGQTLEPVLLEDGRVLSVYRHAGKPGLWANISRIEGEDWVNECEQPIWGYDPEKMISKDSNMVKNFNVLRFGAPSMVRLQDGTLFVAVWAVEDCVSNIRWFKLKVG